MIEGLSILLPTYNCLCDALVTELHRQCQPQGIPYEIIVADDASPDRKYVEQNKAIERLSNVRYILQSVNIGRSAIRNLLAREARYPWLIFIDGDLTLQNPHFIARYLQASDSRREESFRGYEGSCRGCEGTGVRGYENSLVERLRVGELCSGMGEEGNLAPSHPRTPAPPKGNLAPSHPRTPAPPKNTPVIVGGIAIGGDPKRWHTNLRYRYEKHCEAAHQASQRSTKGYQEFRTTNFMVPRQVILRYPFDEDFHHYGYEDVLFGKTLREAGIPILHIDNPILLDDFEDNTTFVSKNEEALRTLFQFREQLEGYSTLLALHHRLKTLHLLPIVKFFYKLTGKAIKNNLLHNNPRFFLLNIYKLFYYSSL